MNVIELNPSFKKSAAPSDNAELQSRAHGGTDGTQDLSVSSQTGSMISGSIPGLKRVAPDLLISQVKNTAPYLFDPEFNLKSHHCDQPFIQSFLKTEPDREMSTYEYYQLAVKAHMITVGTPVPTDVDQHIRIKQWIVAADDLEATRKMAEFVMETLQWDLNVLSRRWVQSPCSGETFGGHLGEWFSIAAGAYGAVRKKFPALAQEIQMLIEREVTKQAHVFLDLKRTKDGLGVLKASYIIAHNLGDLDRVMDAWNLSEDDPLRLSVYHLGHEEQNSSRSSRYGHALSDAGKINKMIMAAENHRHFALRAVKCLRKHPDFLVPSGPFFDDWGKTIAVHPALTANEVGEIAHALYLGWERLQQPKLPPVVGYARAIAGILENFKGGANELGKYLPSKVEKNLKMGLFRSLVSIPQDRFEDQWSKSVFNFLKQIQH
jgi:hypothetical protein